MGLLGSIGQAAGGLLGGVGRFAGLLTAPLTNNLYTDINDPVARQQALLGLSAGLVNGAGVGGAGLMGRQAGQQYLAQQQAQQDEAMRRQFLELQMGAFKDKQAQEQQDAQSGAIFSDLLNRQGVRAFNAANPGELQMQETQAQRSGPQYGSLSQFALSGQGGRYLKDNPVAANMVLPEKQKMPEGMRMGPNGPEWIPGYLEGRAGVAAAGRTSVNVPVNTDKSFFGTLADKAAQQFADQYQVASGAQGAIDSAARVRELLNRTPFTGGLANYKLALAKNAKALGLPVQGETIADTELLVKELGQNVLNNVKSSGLAGSQGLTEGERKFLLDVVGGSINLDGTTLRRIADINERIARNSVKKWNDTYGRISKRPEASQYLDAMGLAPVQLTEPSGNLFAPQPGAPSAPASQRKKIGGKSYVNINGQWYEE